MKKEKDQKTQRSLQRSHDAARKPGPVGELDTCQDSTASNRREDGCWETSQTPQTMKAEGPETITTNTAVNGACQTLLRAAQ